MKIALYYRHIDPIAEPYLKELVDVLHDRGIETCVLETPTSDLRPPTSDFLFSIGGDGTLLSSVQFVDPSHPEAFPPVLGINFGHLGFLTTVGKENLHGMVDELLAGRFTLEERSLLQLRPPTSDFRPQYSLNEVFVHRTEEASLLRTQVYVDEQYVATYAGDGVIVATPTGSTAYSLSCGGPILTPDSRCLLITPISAHTLTLRPIILPDTAKIRLHVDDDCFLGTDSRRTSLAGGSDLQLAKTPFTIRLVRLGQQNFFTAIREKLMWGTEVRS
jgi:NAD+ kinase